MFLSFKDVAENLSKLPQDLMDEACFEHTEDFFAVLRKIGRDGFIREDYHIRHFPNKKCLIYPNTNLSLSLGYKYRSGFYTKLLEVTEVSESGHEAWLEECEKK